MESPARDQRTDDELIQAIRDDRPGAFDQLVEQFGDRLYGFGMKMCGEREDARDVVQDTLLQAYRSLKTLREPRALRSWLYRIASNACLMKRRKGKFEPDRELSLEELMPGSPGSFEIPDTTALPEEEAMRSRSRSEVRQAIAALPCNYRIVIVLRDMEQLSTRETAEALKLPETTVKMRLHRARLAVRDHLQETLGDGVPGRSS